MDQSYTLWREAHEKALAYENENDYESIILEREAAAYYNEFNVLQHMEKALREYDEDM